MLLTRDEIQPQDARAEQMPVWFAALLASECHATGDSAGHRVPWRCVSGRAIYTNAGRDAEVIQPLAVRLRRGETVAVSWLPGDTAYTVELFAEDAKAA